MYIQDDENRQCYLYDYYLQFSVSVVNAKTLKKMLNNKKKKKRRFSKKKAVATVFFRFSHRDKDGKTLKNKEQCSIVEVIKEDVIRKQKIYGDCGYTDFQNKFDYEIQDSSNKDGPEDTNFPSEEAKDEYLYQSTTYIPYYDKILREAFDIDGEFELVEGEEVDANLFGKGGETGKRQVERKESFETKPLRLPRYEDHNRFMPT